jgi:hypothetical protein
VIHRTIPATQTFTSTSTFVASLTATSLVPQTATTSVASVSTVFFPSATDTTVATLQTTVTTVTTQTVQGQVQRRQVTVSATNIPAYASPCADAAAYSSACSCLGITSRVTTTVAGRSTTVSRSTTVPAGQTVSTTASTASVPTTVATDTVTVETTTSAPSFFVSGTTTTATTTVVSTSTTSLGPAPCVPSANLVNGGFESGALPPWSYANNGGASGNVQSAVVAEGSFAFVNDNPNGVGFGAFFHISQSVPVCGATPYILSMAARVVSTTTASCNYYICFDGNCLGPFAAGNTGWSTISVAFITSATATSVEIKIGNDNSIQTADRCLRSLYFDNVTWRPYSFS